MVQQIESKMIEKLTLVQDNLSRKFMELDIARQKHENSLWMEYIKQWINKRRQLELNEGHILQYEQEITQVGEFAPEISQLSALSYKINDTFYQHIEKLRVHAQSSSIDLILDFCGELLPTIEESESVQQIQEEQLEENHVLPESSRDDVLDEV